MSQADRHIQPAQAPYLDELCARQAPVAIYLVNGVRVRGVPLTFDAYAVLMATDHGAQLVYKHAIASIMPATPSERA